MKRIAEPELRALPGVACALQRAAYRARVIAANTRTPLVISVNGQIEKRWIENGDPVELREDFDRYLAAVPDPVPPEEDQLT